MSESVIRHRGGGRDENGQLISATDTTLSARAVAPGGGAEFVAPSRDGESIDAVVYFARGVDLVNSDELTVRGQRYQIVVNDWRSPWTSFGGLEVLCTRGQG
jgi:hypothetical protein